MSLFLLTFFLLYSCLHLYTFFKIRGGLSFGPLTAVALTAFMAVMVSAPVLVRVSERHGFDVAARLLSYIGYTWMGLVFIFFCLSVAIDLYRLFLYTGGLIIQRDLSYIIPTPRVTLIMATMVTLTIASLGYFEARNIRNDTVVIKTPKLPEEIGTLTIAQISDVHLGLIVREDRLRRIVKKVNEAQPDILVSTGDLVDGQIDNLAGLAEILKTVHPKHGKFAVTGNHEFYAGLDQALDFIQEAGFRVLRGEALTVAGIVNIVGIDYPTGRHVGMGRDVGETELLQRLPRDKFTILLKHQPVVDDSALGLFDLQLSGHTHKGQIFPFSLITRLFFPRHAGLFALSDNHFLYVNRGSGTWGPPIRFLAPPEVTVIKLIPGDKKAPRGKTAIPSSLEITD